MMTFEQMISFSPKNWFVEIDNVFRDSPVSYYGLSDYVPHFSNAASVVQRLNYCINLDSELSASCMKLYGLLHARYIITQDGAQLMNLKYRSGLFGHCPREMCNEQNLLPVGLSDIPDKDTVKGFCPRCHDIYELHKNIDGAFFGSSFPLMFMKIMKMPTRFPRPSPSLSSITTEDGKELLPIHVRLVRWGQKL